MSPVAVECEEVCRTNPSVWNVWNFSVPIVPALTSPPLYGRGYNRSNNRSKPGAGGKTAGASVCLNCIPAPVDRTAHYYDVLHLARSASTEEIRQAYLDLVRVWHPDRFTSEARLQGLAEERLKEINEAYDALLSVDSTGPEPLPERPARTPVRRARAVGAQGLGFWLRVLGFCALIVAFLFGVKSALDFNPAPRGPSGNLPAEIERPPDAKPRPAGRAAPKDADLEPDPGAMGEFQLHNESDLDCAVQVFSRNAPQAVLPVVFVRARDDAAIRGLKPGVYRLRVDFGTEWNRATLAFARPARGYGIGPFQFFQTETAVERTGLRYNVRLSLPESGQ